MINIRFPDNTKKQFPNGTNALDIAKNISEGLARNVLAARIDGIIIDATQALPNNKELKFAKRGSLLTPNEYWILAGEFPATCS